MASRGYRFALGEVVYDKVTGFEGVVIGRSDHISGGDTFGVLPTVLKDGTRLMVGVSHDTRWFDEPRLATTGRAVDVVDAQEVRTGADSIPQATR